MRIAEIAIVGPGLDSKKKFIHVVADEVLLETESLIFGRLQVNEQLVVHLYGFDVSEREISPSWDLVSRKLLGYIVLFNWNNPDSYALAASTVDFLSSRYDIPLVIAANLKNGQTPVPQQLVDSQLRLSDRSQFTFCKLSDPVSVKNVLISLVNTVIDTMY